MYENCVVILPYIENYDRVWLQNIAASADYIICADGGQVIASRNGIMPNVVIGDFDSTKEKIQLDCKYIKYPSEKDFTDAEACIIHALEMSTKKVTFVGGMGGRLDHTLGALALPIKYNKEGINIEYIDKSNHVRLLENGSIEIDKTDNYKYFSVVPAYANASGVTIKGAKYPLDNVILERASTLGISNEIIAEKCQISVTKGSIYIIESNDR